MVVISEPGSVKIGKSQGGHDRGEQIVARHHPLVRLLLDADEVVVGEPMRAGMVLRLNGMSAISNHEIQHRDGATQHRKPGHER